MPLILRFQYFFFHSVLPYSISRLHQCKNFLRENIFFIVFLFSRIPYTYSTQQMLKWTLLIKLLHYVPGRHKWAKKLSELLVLIFHIQIACLMPWEEEFLNSIGRFRICLLSSTADSAQVWWKWAELAVLFNRQLIKASMILISL